MKKRPTELVFILDKSGSMSGLEQDTIGGFNAMLTKQKAVEGDCRITTVLFSECDKLLHDRIDIRAVGPMTEQEYAVGGSTALLDAIGKTIHKIKNAQKATAEAYRAEKVLFVIITDGQENSSRCYDTEQVKSMIEKQKNDDRWEFVFLGANIDAVETAGRFGIHADRAQSYHADAEGIAKNYDAISAAVLCYRTSSEMPKSWNSDIDKDYNKRKKQ